MIAYRTDDIQQFVYLIKETANEHATIRLRHHFLSRLDLREDSCPKVVV